MRIDRRWIVELARYNDECLSTVGYIGRDGKVCGKEDARLFGSYAKAERWLRTKAASSFAQGGSFGRRAVVYRIHSVVLPPLITEVLDA